MIGAIVVLLIVVVGFVVLRGLNRVAPQKPASAVDYQQSADYASDEAGFDVLAPEQLSKGWKATSVEFVPNPVRWHLGLLTAQGQYVGLEQSKSSAKDMVTTYVDEEAERGNEVDIGAQTWESWTDDGGDSALVRTDGSLATLVVGSVQQDVLVDYVRSLR